MVRGRHLASFAPLALLAVAGCLATKGDIALLQDQLRTMQSSIAQADSARRTQLDATAQLIIRTGDSLRSLSDSLRSLGGRFTTFQAKTTGELYNIGQQLIAVQELTGQTQRRLQDFRASLEAQREQAASAAPSDTGHPMVPGPSELYQGAFDQFSRGSYAVARGAFQDLLARYPEFDQAPRAQMYIGEAFDAEQNRAAADSVYQLVATKYPRSGEPAATSLYKYAQSQIAQGHKDIARVALNKVIRDYPTTDAAGLAKNLLSTIQ